MLIGAGTYADREDPGDLLSAVNSMDAVRDFLQGEWNLDASRCRRLPDPLRADDVLDALHEAASDLSVTDTLLVYYCGHGLLDDRENLLLALHGSSKERPDKALDYDKVQKHLHRSKARRKIVILDCCFAARAFGLQGGDLEGKTDIEGAVVIAASGPTVRAVAPSRERYTAFTGALVHVLRQGMKGGPEFLSLNAVFDEARIHLLRGKRPAPWISDMNGAARMPFVLNRANGNPRVPAEFSDEVACIVRCADDTSTTRVQRAHADWAVRIEDSPSDGRTRHPMWGIRSGPATQVKLAPLAILRLLDLDTDLPLCLLARWLRALGHSDVMVRDMLTELASAAIALAPAVESEDVPSLVLSIRPGVLDSLAALDDDQVTEAHRALLKAAYTFIASGGDGDEVTRDTGACRPEEGAWTLWSPLAVLSSRCGAAYVWRDLPGRLSAAGRDEERTALVSDPRWILHRSRGARGVGMALRDLFATGDKGREVAEALSSWAHLVDGADPAGTDASVLCGRGRANPVTSWWDAHGPDAPRWQLDHASDTEPPQVVRVLGGSGGPVTGCSVHPDGTRLLITNEQGIARLWELPTGVLLATADRTESGLADCLLLDSRRALLIGNDGTACLWDLLAGRAHGDPLSTPSGGFRGCRGIAAGLAACLGRGDRSVHLLTVPADASGGSLRIAHAFPHRHSVAGAALVDGHTLLTLTDADSLSAWDIHSGQRLITQSRQAWRWRDLAELLPQDHVEREGYAKNVGRRGWLRLRLLGFGGASEARLAAWWIQAHDQARAVAETVTSFGVGTWGTGPGVVAAALAEDACRLATLDADGFVTLHVRGGPDAAHIPKRVRRKAHTAAGHSVHFTGNGAGLVTAGNDGFVRLWNLGRLLDDGSSRPDPAPPVIACLRTGREVLVVREDSTAHVTTAPAPSPPTPSETPHRVPAVLAAAAPLETGRWLLLAGEEGRVTFRSGADVTARGTTEDPVRSPHRTAVVAAAGSPDGGWAATIARDGEALLWQMTAPDPFARPIMGRHAFHACCFDSSSRHLWLADATSLHDLDLSVANATSTDDTGRPSLAMPLAPRQLPRPPTGADDVSPPTALHWGAGTLYRAARALLRVTAEGHVLAERELRHPVTALALSGDGRHLAGVGRDGLVWCWDAETLDVLACHRLMPPLTDCAWEADSTHLIVGQATGVSRLHFVPGAAPELKESFHDCDL
ncbi:caspase, EACC1-associated type [Streptomyces sp. NPDC001709]